MPGSGQWQLVTNPLTDGECWICSLSSYSLIFWSEESAKFAKKMYHAVQAKTVIQKLLSIQSKKLPDTKDPLIFSDFNDWQPEKLYEIFEYSEKLDPKFD